MQAGRRPRVTAADRGFWVVLRRLWREWSELLGVRQARDGRPLAPRRLPPPRELALPPRSAGSAPRPCRGPRAGPETGDREPDLCEVDRYVEQGGPDPVAALGLLQRASHNFFSRSRARIRRAVTAGLGRAVVHLGKVLHTEVRGADPVLDEKVVENFIERHRAACRCYRRTPARRQELEIYERRKVM